MSITLLPEVTERVRPPRALFVDRPLGFPLGEPHNTDLQERIVMSALVMTADLVEDLVVRDYAAL